MPFLAKVLPSLRNGGKGSARRALVQSNDHLLQGTPFLRKERGWGLGRRTPPSSVGKEPGGLGRRVAGRACAAVKLHLAAIFQQIQMAQRFREAQK